MKNALILHGTGSSPQENWFPWLKKKLEESGYLVWLPQLPHAEKPNLRRYNKFILSNKKWQFNQESVLIGHSSGAVAILGLLQNLPDQTIVDTCILVGAFRDDLGWDSLQELFLDPFDFAKIQNQAKRIIFVHADNDPHCPLAGAKYLQKKLDAELVILPGQKHFSVGTFGEKYREFPFLLELLYAPTFVD